MGSACDIQSICGVDGTDRTDFHQTRATRTYFRRSKDIQEESSIDIMVCKDSFEFTEGLRFGCDDGIDDICTKPVIHLEDLKGEENDSA